MYFSAVYTEQRETATQRVGYNTLYPRREKKNKLEQKKESRDK